MNPHISYTHSYLIKRNNRESRFCTKFSINLLPDKWVSLVTYIY